MSSYDIEISLDVEIQAGIAFWIEKAIWNGMDEEQRRQKIMDRLNSLNEELSNDVVRFRDGNISAMIMGPEKVEDINLEKVQIYDPGD